MRRLKLDVKVEREEEGDAARILAPSSSSLKRRGLPSIEEALVSLSAALKGLEFWSFSK